MPEDGNFVLPAGDETRLKFLRRGEFGYIDPEDIIVDRDRAYLSADTTVMRYASGEQAVKVSFRRRGVVVEFLGGLKRDSWSSREFMANDVRVVQVSCDGRTYARWTKKQFYVSLRTMEIEAGGFAHRRHFKRERGLLRAMGIAEVYTHPRPGHVRVRRLEKDVFEVQLKPNTWSAFYLH